VIAVEIISALALFGMAAAAAFALPRWHTPYGPIAETYLLFVALALRGQMAMLGLPVSARCVPAIAIGYALVRLQRFAADEAELAKPVRVWRGLFHSGAVARSLHLIPLVVCILCEMAFGPAPSLFRATDLPAPLTAPLTALISPRGAIVVAVGMVAGSVLAQVWT